MEENVSRKAVLVLVVLALVVSILSTTMVLNAISHFSPPQQPGPASTTATARLIVPEQPPTAQATLEVN